MRLLLFTSVTNESTNYALKTVLCVRSWLSIFTASYMDLVVRIVITDKTWCYSNLFIHLLIDVSACFQSMEIFKSAS